MKNPIIVVLLSLALIGCTANIPAENQIQNQNSVKTEVPKLNGLEKFKISSPQFDEVFNGGEWKGNGDGFAYEFKTAPEASVYAYRISNFEDKSNGIGDYAISKVIKEKLDNEADPCIVLDKIRKGSIKFEKDELYLPINIQKPFLCKNAISENGTKTISLIGTADVYESLPNMGDMIMVLRNDDVIILNNLVSDSGLEFFNDDRQKTIDDFLKANPDTDYPNPSFKKLEQIVQTKLDKSMNNSNNEFKEGLKYLDRLAESIVSI